MTYTRKPQHNLSVSSLQRNSWGYTAARAAVDSDRPAQAEDESLWGSRVVHPCSNQFDHNINVPTFDHAKNHLRCTLRSENCSFFSGDTSLRTERTKYDDVKLLDGRLCLVSFGSIDRQLISFGACLTLLRSYKEPQTSQASN